MGVIINHKFECCILTTMKNSLGAWYTYILQNNVYKAIYVQCKL